MEASGPFLWLAHPFWKTGSSNGPLTEELEWLPPHWYQKPRALGSQCV